MSKIGFRIKRIYVLDKRFKVDRWMEGQIDGWMNGWMDKWMDKWIEYDFNNVYVRLFIKQGCIFMKKQIDIVNIIYRNFLIKEINLDFFLYCIFLNINSLF